MTDNLPPGWERVTLGDLGTWTSGGTPPRSRPEYYGGTIPWIKTGDLPDGIVDAELEKISEAGMHASSAKLLPEGTLLMAMYGATIGKLGILAAPAATNQACAALLSVGRTRDVIRYVFYYLLSIRDELRAAGQGGAQPNLSQTLIKAMSVPLPPLNEQRRIVAKIEMLTARSRRAKEALDAIPPLLEKLRQSILAAAFRGDLTDDWRAQHPDVEPASELLKRIRTERRCRWEEAELAKMKAKGKVPGDDRWKAKYKEPEPVDAEGLPELPEGWEWASISEVGTLQLGQRRAPEFAKEAPYPYIRAANITWNGLDLREVKVMGFADPESLFLRQGDVLLNEASGSPREVGKPALWRGEINGCCYQATVLRVRPVSVLASGSWLYHALLRNALLGDFAALAPGMGILHLTAERMRDWPVPIAPVMEQQEIVRILGASSAAILSLEELASAILSDASILDAAVFAKAFRGELVSQDPIDEPASVLLERIHRENAMQRKPARRRSRHTAREVEPT